MAKNHPRKRSSKHAEIATATNQFRRAHIAQCRGRFCTAAYIHRRQGHCENCAKDLEHAVQLDPRNIWLLQDTAQTYQFLRRFPEAAATWVARLQLHRPIRIRVCGAR